MKRILGISAALAALATLSMTPSAAAQEQYTFTIGAMGGLGGSLDAEVGDELDNSSLQLNLAVVTEPRTHVGLRLGQIDLDVEGGFTDLLDAELTYATIGGEYRFDHQYYQSGVYLALGGYKLEGTSIFGTGTEDETSIGLAIGATGDFAVTRSISVIFEVSGHYVTFDDAQIFLAGHGGLAFHF